MPRVELLPAPLIPSNPKHSPRGMPKEVFFTATFATPPLDGYTFRRPSICICGGPSEVFLGRRLVEHIKLKITKVNVWTHRYLGPS